VTRIGRTGESETRTKEKEREREREREREKERERWRDTERKGTMKGTERVGGSEEGRKETDK